MEGFYSAMIKGGLLMVSNDATYDAPVGRCGHGKIQVDNVVGQSELEGSWQIQPVGAT